MDSVFVFKKTIKIFFDPVALVLGALFWSAVLAWAARRLQKKHRDRAMRVFRRGAVGLIILAALLLYLVSLGPVSEMLTRSLERQHTENIGSDGEYSFAEDPAYIVILGGGQRRVSGKPMLSGLTRHAMGRVVGGVDLWKNYPNAKIVFTGQISETKTMREIAVRLGASEELILMETESRDTKDHPVFLKPILGNSPFLLVTSATHMPRAVGLFRGQGLEPMPAPVDFQSWPKGRPYDLFSPTALAPKGVNLYRSAVAVHEWFGLAWAGFRGQIQPLRSK